MFTTRCSGAGRTTFLLGSAANADAQNANISTTLAQRTGEPHRRLNLFSIRMPYRDSVSNFAQAYLEAIHDKETTLLAFGAIAKITCGNGRSNVSASIQHALCFIVSRMHLSNPSIQLVNYCTSSKIEIGPTIGAALCARICARMSPILLTLGKAAKICDYGTFTQLNRQRFDQRCKARKSPKLQF